MHVERNVGLQWKIGLANLIGAVVSASAVAAGYALLRRLGLDEPGAVLGGLFVGIVAAFLGAMLNFWRARSLKLRLWEAGDLAARIARGDFGRRLVPGSPDELGWLESQLNQMAGHLEQAVAELQILADQNRSLAEQAGRGAALEERTRLARDLHDTVNQQLFALSIGIASVRRNLSVNGLRANGLSVSGGSGKDETVIDQLEDLERMAREAHGQIRELILQLRPVSLERHGLGPALKEYAARIAKDEGWRLETELEEGVSLAADVREHLFRLGQEALANVRRHARASCVTLSLHCDEDSVTLAVRDDGVGFDPKRLPRPTAVGIVGMRERMRSIGGSLMIESTPGEGTTVTAKVPLAAAAQPGDGRSERAAGTEQAGYSVRFPRSQQADHLDRIEQSDIGAGPRRAGEAARNSAVQEPVGEPAAHDSPVRNESNLRVEE